jgi:hypothetical protein
MARPPKAQDPAQTHLAQRTRGREAIASANHVMILAMQTPVLLHPEAPRKASLEELQKRVTLFRFLQQGYHRKRR